MKLFGRNLLDSVVGAATLIGLTPVQTLEAVRLYAAGGNVGPRLYDWLIGQTAVQHGVGHIITWNVGHFRGLFPGLRVETPDESVAGSDRWP